MAMTPGSAQGLASDLNVTPLIDVLLVLLIIFMVIVPVTPRGQDALVPQPAKSDNAPDSAIVVQILRRAGQSPMYRINQEIVAKQDLLGRLSAIYANRSQRALFVKGDDDIEFTQVAEVIDIGHAAGADQVGLITPKSEINGL